MTLKVRINGQMKQITGPGNSPVTFVNGEKKKLAKGVTFVNGEKKVLWDTHSLQIWKINIDDIGSKGILFNASNKYAFLYSGKNIYKINIENKSAPVLVSSSKLGQITLFSPLDSTNSNMVYYAIADDYKAQQININTADYSIFANNVVNFTSGSRWGNRSGGLIGTNNWLGASLANPSLLYANTTSVGVFFSTGTSTVGTVSPSLAKRDATSYLGCGNKGLSVLTATAITPRVPDVLYQDILVDGTNIVCAGSDGFAIFNTNFDKITSKSVAEYRHCYLLGKIRGYYYVVEAPRNVQASDKNVYLQIYTTEGVLFSQINMNLSIELSGNANFANPVRTVPHISSSGMLGFYFYSSVYSGAVGTLVIIQGY